MKGVQIRHYWDGDQRVGAAVQQFVRGLDAPAWDFWMIYRPGILWEHEAPEPDWWEHQLGVLDREYPELRLDAKRFVRKAQELAP